MFNTTYIFFEKYLTSDLQLTPVLSFGKQFFFQVFSESYSKVPRKLHTLGTEWKILNS